MYCGKNKTALGSLDQIAQALTDLLERKNFDSISVSEICRASGVSRQTFYNLYSSKEDIVIYILQGRYCSIPESNDTEPLKLICSEYAHYITDNRELLDLLTDNNIIYLLYDSICSSLNSCCTFTGSCHAGRLPYQIGFFAGAITGFVSAYCRQDEQMSREDIAGALYDLFTLEK